MGHQLNFQPRYKGRDLAFMHSHMVEKGLTMEHFDSVLRHFCQTLRQLNMPQVRFWPYVSHCVILASWSHALSHVRRGDSEAFSPCSMLYAKPYPSSACYMLDTELTQV